jgi:hypothetical protein
MVKTDVMLIIMVVKLVNIIIAFVPGVDPPMRRSKIKAIPANIKNEGIIEAKKPKTKSSSDNFGGEIIFILFDSSRDSFITTIIGENNGNINGRIRRKIESSLNISIIKRGIK